MPPILTVTTAVTRWYWTLVVGGLSKFPAETDAYNGFDFDELYDLQQDPHEMVNLAEDPAYQTAKRELVQKMWKFAAQENDIIFNPYGTVALAPWGPLEGLRPN